MKKSNNERLFPYLLAVPALVVICALTIFPVLYNFYLSAYQKHAFLPAKTFVGLSNYINLMNDKEFWTSFLNGVVYSAATIVLQIVLGLLAALLLNKQFRGRDLLRGVVFFPYLMPTVVVVILWKWLLNASYGLVNYVLLSLHLIHQPIVWLSNDMIMTTLIFVSVWQFFPFVVVTLLARLQSIPEDLYRAASVDGAPPVSQFFHITLPQLRGVLITVVLLRSIWMFTKFDTVWLLAGKEAVGKYIETLPVYTFRMTFTYLQAGMGATLAVVLFLILLASTIAYMKATGGRETKS